MYKTRVKEEINVDTILRSIREEELWEKYLGFLPKPGKCFICPPEVRQEDSPSCNLFYLPNGKLLMKDFGGEAYNIWQFIQIKEKLNFYEALEKVYYDWKLGKMPINKEVNRVQKIQLVSTRSVIQIKSRDWGFLDRHYWDNYGISTDLLEDYNICPVEHYWINGHLFTPKTICYSYNFGEGKRKLYSPLEEEWKWISNVPQSIYSGYDQLDLVADILVVTKAMKEVLLWRILGYNAISPQNECLIPKTIIEKLNKRFDKIYCNFDTDSHGRKYSKMNKEAYGLKELFTPAEKNISDFCYVYGLENTREMIKEFKI